MGPRSFLAAAALLTSSLVAHAATITQTFSEDLSYTTAYPPVPTTVALAGFNPALGTLTSISGTLSGTESSSGGIGFFLNTPGGTSFVGYESQVPSDNAPSSGSYYVSDSVDYAPSIESAVGNAPVDFRFYLEGYNGGSATVDLSGTVTYNYTPNVVSATPEPSGIALLGTGLLGVAGLVRKRFA